MSYSTSLIQKKTIKEITLRVEIYRLKPAQEWEEWEESEAKIISLTGAGVTQEMLEKAIKVMFPEWSIFCCWEVNTTDEI